MQRPLLWRPEPLPPLGQQAPAAPGKLLLQLPPDHVQVVDVRPVWGGHLVGLIVCRVEAEGCARTGPSWAAAALIIGGQGGCRAPNRPAKVGEGRLKVRLVGASSRQRRQLHGSGGTNKEQGHKNAVRAIRLRCAPDCSMFKRTQVC